MFDKITQDLKEAMKNKDATRLNALRLLKAKLIENKTSKKPLPELEVVIAHHKKLKDSIETYPEGHALRTQLLEEIKVLSEYLPQSLNETEVRAIIQNIIEQGAANMGMVMKELSPQIKGRFDGKRATELVNEMLKK